MVRVVHIRRGWVMVVTDRIHVVEHDSSNLSLTSSEEVHSFMRVCVCVYACVYACVRLVRVGLRTATHIAVVALNYAAVSQVGPFEREVVEGCVRETLLLLPRALASGGPAHLALQGVGTLSIRNHKVRPDRRCLLGP
jgi:hypothetical protein